MTTVPGPASSIPGLALSCDGDGRIRSLLHDSVRLKRRIRVGELFNQVLEPHSVAKASTFLGAVRAQRAAFGWEMNVVAKGSIVPLQFSGITVNDAEILIVATPSHLELDAYQDDLMRINNQLVNLQRELAGTNRDLALLNEQKNQLLGIAAHDLRNPLAAVSMFSGLLLSESPGPVTEKQRDILHRIRGASKFMGLLVNDLLDVAQIESGKLRLDLQTTDLNDLARDNVEVNRMFAEEKAIELRFDSSGEPLMRRLDRFKMEQVLNNLVGNAIKFSPRGTRISVRLRAEGDADLLEVADQGPGIPPDEINSLFQPFGRTSVTATGGERSTGLGLAIVRKIVEGHGGTVHVDSVVGQGSTFVVTLPRTAAPPA